MSGHRFEVSDGATGQACTRLVIRGGYGEDCGLPPEAHTAIGISLEARCPECGHDVSTGPPCRVCKGRCCRCVHAEVDAS